MPPHTEHLVGRTDEISLLDRALEELDQGRPAAVEVVGEPGIGKTRLLAELADRADERRQLVLSGSASELERDLPFSVFVDALDEYLRALDRARFDALDDDVRTELAHVFPSLTALATEHAVALQHERYRSHRAVRELLERLAAGQPLVLVLDDLHWADPASVELVGTLLRRPPAARVLLALAVRPRQVPERLSVALERAHRAGLLTRIELDALSAEEARELLGDAVESADANVLYEESGGNPFYLEQLARSLDRAAPATAAHPETPLASMGVPSTVAAALAEELALLSDSARRALEGAAVAGDPFEPELAAAAAEMPEVEVMDAVDELLDLDLLRPTDMPRRFRFRHPLVRRAVYEATAGGWRLGAHERCAAALATRGAPATVRAHHVERSAREGDRRAAAVLREAGEGAVRLAPASAAHWFGEALSLLPKNASAEERVELLFARAGALTAVGRFDDSHGVLLEALAIVPDEEHALRARLARTCAAVESLLGRHEQAAGRLTDALDSLPDRSSPEAVALMIDLAQNGIWRARYNEMYEWAESAVHAARGLGDAALTAAALAGLAIAESMRGAPERAEAARAEADALVDLLSDDELARHIQASALLGGVELYLDRYAEADAHANRALAVARASGEGEHVLVLIQTVGAVWRQQGKLAEAAELLDGGIEAARVLGNTHALAWGLSTRSSTALRAGDVQLALAAAQESVDLCKDAGANFHSAEAAADLAAALLETGEPERAADLLVGSAGGEELVMIAGSPRCRYLEVLARCRLALDLPDRRETHGRLRGGVGGGIAAPDGCSLGRPGGGGRRPAQRGSGACRRACARVGRNRRRGRYAGRGRPVAHPRRSCTRAGRRGRPRRGAATAGRPGVRVARRPPLPGRGRGRASQARSSRLPAHPTGDVGRGRPGVADRPGAPARPARRRPEDEPTDRRRALPQPEDGRDASAQHLPQGRRLLTGRARAGRRARRPRRLAPQ